MRILAIGGGSLAFYLCRQALSKGHHVTAIVQDPLEAEELSRRLGVIAVLGDGTDPALLREVETDRMDVVVALRDRDEDNLIVCQVAQRFFSVARIVALVNDPDNRSMFERLGVSPTVSAVEIIGAAVEQESTFTGIAARLSMAHGRVAVLEVRLQHDSPAVGRSLAQLSLPDGALVAGVLREDAMLVPHSGMTLIADDELLLVSQPDAQDAALERLVGRTE